MIQMAELVKDPIYKRYLQTKPTLPGIARNPKKVSSPPWVVYVQKTPSGPWGKREFWKYSEAFNFVKKALRLGVHDVALNCKRVGFDPPSRFVRIRGKYITGRDGVRRQATKRVYWQPHLEPGDADHHWCRYCRRPTVFKYYRRHKALKLPEIDTTTPRCCICGASARIALSSSDRHFRIH